MGNERYETGVGDRLNKIRYQEAKQPYSAPPVSRNFAHQAGVNSLTTL
jgi:hypothetical protein